MVEPTGVQDEAGAAPANDRPVSTRGRRTRDALVAGARTVFERDGYAEARITDITAEAGVGTGSFYTHFAGKDEVFAAVMAELQDEMLHPHLGDHADEASSAGDREPGDPIGSIRRAHVAYLSAYRDNARFMALVDQVAALNPDLLAARLARGDAFAERNAGLIRRLQDQGLADATLDPLPTAHALNAMASRMANLVFVHAYPLTFDELTDTITHLWANALGLSR
jgi:AcrR family transcriptional regulator